MEGGRTTQWNLKDEWRKKDGMEWNGRMEEEDRCSAW